MSLYNRGGVWWFEFVFKGERVRESTKQGHKRTAEQLEAAKRTQLAKAEVGIRISARSCAESSKSSSSIHCGTPALPGGQRPEWTPSS